jgi:uncharacterized protein DUF6765
MQKDFHFYAIYSLCRLARFDSERARTIAHASQYVDDETGDNDIALTLTPSLKPIATAHRNISPLNFDPTIQENIHLPFHFVPRVAMDKTVDNPQDRRNLTTAPDCEIARSSLKQAVAAVDEPNQNHQIGIALHAYADTWSHQGFSGLHGPENDAEFIEQKNRNPILKFMGRLWHAILEFIIPAIGHGEVFTLPDQPFKTWNYFNFFKQTLSGEIDNVSRCTVAAHSILTILGGTDYKFEDNFRSIFERIFKTRGTLETRCERWQEAIANNYFGFADHNNADKVIAYDKRRWPERAIEVGKNDPTFEDPASVKHCADWIHFQRAAIAHRKFVLNAVQSTGTIISASPVKVAVNKFAAFVASLFKIERRKSFTAKSARRALFRFAIYGSILTFGEIGFYTLVKIGRIFPAQIVRDLFTFEWCVDPRLHLEVIWNAPIKTLFGQASLWMFLVYATIGLFGIEPVYKRIKNQFFILRGLTYMMVILFMEWGLGWILCPIIGYDIWYYTDPLSFGLKYTSLAIAPMWFISGLVAENFVNFVSKYNEKKGLLNQIEAETSS